jgi:hypothetical protein
MFTAMLRKTKMGPCHMYSLVSFFGCHQSQEPKFRLSDGCRHDSNSQVGRYQQRALLADRYADGSVATVFYKDEKDTKASLGVDFLTKGIAPDR